MKTRKLTRMERRYLPWLAQPGTDVVVTKTYGRCFIRSLSEDVKIHIHHNTLRRLEKLGYLQFKEGVASVRNGFGPRVPGTKYRMVWARFVPGDNWSPGKNPAALLYWLKKGVIPVHAGKR